MKKSQLTAALLLAVFCLALTPEARAASFTYQFLPGTTATLNGIVETITGSFTYDSATDMLSAVNITLSGLSPYSGTYMYDFNSFGWNYNDCLAGCTFGIGVAFAGLNDDSGRLLGLHFGGELGVDATASLASVGAYNAGNLFSTEETGGVSLVPEPSSALLLGLGLTGLGVRRRSLRRA